MPWARKELRLFVLVVVAQLLPRAVPAQEGYTVSGQVTDSRSGNGLGGVTVALTVVMNVVKSATSGPDGSYTINNVQPGYYSLSGQLDHYTFEAENITVNGDLPDQNFTGTGAAKSLAVTALAQRKDTTCLCLDGCDRTDANSRPWNGSHQGAATPGTHSSMYCGWCAVTMANRYHGGTITQDEVAFNRNGTGAPEGDISHGTGCNLADVRAALKWALNDVNSASISAWPLNPAPVDDLKNYIDAERIILAYNPFHWTVISGYRRIDKQWHFRLLNSDMNGGNEWLVLPNEVWEFLIPPANAVGRERSEYVGVVGDGNDDDEDGVNSFDELHRWIFGCDLDWVDEDSDDDGLEDGMDIEGYLYDGSTHNANAFDPDGAEGRCEVDPDSDNGGVLDGDEDVNKNGDVDDGETNPYSPVKPGADDIPKAKISLTPSVTVNQEGEERTVVKVGNITATFVFLRDDATTALPVNSVTVGPVDVKYTPNGGTATAVLPLTASDTPPTDEWTGTLAITAAMKNGRATFAIKNGDTVVAISEGEHFWIDTKDTEQEEPAQD